MHIVNHTPARGVDDPRPCAVRWCELPAGHDAERHDGRREHTWLVSDDPELGSVTVTRTDSPQVDRRGPLTVRLAGVPTTLALPQYVDLVDGLLLARAELAVLDAEDGVPVREVAQVLAEAGRLLAEHVRGPGAAAVLARVDDMCVRVGVRR